MFRFVLCALLLLGGQVLADVVVLDKPSVTLSLSRRLNLKSGSAHALVRHDQLRAQALKARGLNAHGQFKTGTIIKEPITNTAVTYVASVGIGSPPTNYSLLVDTGSSNTWLGAGKPYVNTSTSIATGDSVSVTYGSGHFQGREYFDQVTLAPGLVIKNQSIGVSSYSEGFQDIDGILGIGPVALTRGTLSPSFDLAPTVTDNLYKAGLLAGNKIGIYFAPTTKKSVVNGELSWGGADGSKYTGTLTWIPITSTHPSSQFWGIDQTIRYGSSTPILSCTAGITDTGTTLILLATDAYKRYKTATGAVEDPNVGLLRLTSSQYAKLQSLYLTTGGRTFELTANAQIWPRTLNSLIGGTSSGIYLMISDLGSSSGEGLDFVNGYAFLERYYSVIDTTNKQIGFATTAYTKATSN